MGETRPDTQLPTRAETITALVHYYRAEVQRSLAWRDRLDRTTNWAIGTSAAFLGFGFTHPEITHLFFLFGLSMAYILLFVEARRYRFYDAYEYRIRLMNQHFIYGFLIDGQPLEESTRGEGVFWRAELASDLRYPQYKMALSHALGRRLRANYIYLFFVLLCGWLLKIKIHPLPAHTLREYIDHAGAGEIPGEAVLLFMGLFTLHLLVFLRLGKKEQGGRDIFHSHFSKKTG